MEQTLRTASVFMFLLLHCIDADSHVPDHLLEQPFGERGLEIRSTDSAEIPYERADSIETETEGTHPDSEHVKCEREVRFQGRYEILENDFAFVPSYNRTFSPALYEKIGSELILCMETNDGEVIGNTSGNGESEKSGLDCQKWVYEHDEFKILDNGSVVILNEVFGPETYEKDGDDILMCAPDNKEDQNVTVSEKREYSVEEKVLIYIGNILTGISVIALSLHLIVFFLVLDNRNLPGYNLASLSLSLLLGYSFFLIGQIPEVLGTPCILSGLLQQYFFLASFFWMNIMAFDVWRALQLATTKLHVSSKKIKVRKFLLYSACAWVFPLAFLITSVVADNVDAFPHEYKPFFGRSDYCWFTNGKALLAFFAGPIFSLIGVNSIFFAMTAYIIVHNSIKEQRDQHVTAARRNFMLYVRLGLIMGVTWLIGIVGNLTNNNEVWFVFTVLNTTQGLFIFVFFTCAPNAKKTFKRKTRYKVSKRPPRNPQVRHVSEIDEKFRMTTPKTVCCI